MDATSTDLKRLIFPSLRDRIRFDLATTRGEARQNGGVEDQDSCKSELWLTVSCVP
jgi:hypothetical protein